MGTKSLTSARRGQLLQSAGDKQTSGWWHQDLSYVWINPHTAEVMFLGCKPVFNRFNEMENKKKTQPTKNKTNKQIQKQNSCFLWRKAWHGRKLSKQLNKAIANRLFLGRGDVLSQISPVESAVHRAVTLLMEPIHGNQNVQLKKCILNHFRLFSFPLHFTEIKYAQNPRRHTPCIFFSFFSTFCSCQAIPGWTANCYAGQEKWP